MASIVRIARTWAPRRLPATTSPPSFSIAATSDLLAQVDQWIHFYVEAVSTILQENRGDWGDGLFYSGAYEVEVKPPQAGGSGFLQVARVSCELGVSRN